MRLKQLLGVIILTAFACATALGANSQLTNVNVNGQGHATTVILHANGAFTHTEYRPVDNLLLVDLAGVTAGKLKDTAQTVNRPGVTSYRVLGYTGANGSEVARVELTLTAGAVVNVAPVTGGLEVRVSDVSGSAPAPAPAATPAETKPAITPKPVVEMAAAEQPSPAPQKTAAVAPHAKLGHPVQVKHVSVLRGKSGMEVEITASAPVSETPKVMKLTAPDRLVVDIPNAVPVGAQKPILVNNADIKEVRMGRFQAQPPVTRVVVDLAQPQDYVVGMSGNKLSLRLHSLQAQNSTPAPVMTAAAPVAKPVAAADKAPVTARDFVPTSAPAKTETVAPVTAKVEAPEKPALDSKAAADAAAKVMSATTPVHPDPMLAPQTSATMAQPIAANLSAQQQQQQAARPMQQPGSAGRYTGEPISVNLKDVDLKDFFRLIHEISGLNIILDPNVKGTLTLVLDDVPWDQALDIVLQNNGLDKRLEGNVLRIATRDTFRAEAEARRAQQEAQALSVEKTQYTHFLSYARAADVQPIVKKFLSQRGDVVADPRLNALIITDIPSTIPDVQRILNQLDKKTQQVEIEARVVAATRNFARDLGVQLGFGTGNNVFAIGGAGVVGTSPLQVNVPTPLYFVTGSSIPLFSNLGAVGPTTGISIANATKNYRVDAVLTAAEDRGLLKILSRPRVVTQNNMQATVKQGTRIPVVTAAQLGGPPTTTYVEAALRLQVTPQITAEGTIFMNLELENTTPDFGHQVSGNPSLLTQLETTQVMVNDGGTVAIGGVIQTQNSINVFQVPLLGDIPVLGNLFKRRAVSTSTQELIFFITPKIV